MCAETRMPRWTGTELIHESRCRETLRKPQFGSNPTGLEEKAKPGNPWVEAAGSTKASGWFWSEIEMMTLLFCFLFFFLGHNKRFPTAVLKIPNNNNNSLTATDS